MTQKRRDRNEGSNPADYNRAGFQDRNEYLADLADNYSPALVYTLADMLGPSEDFDGLISELEDAEESGDFED